MMLTMTGSELIVEAPASVHHLAAVEEVHVVDDLDE